MTTDSYSPPRLSLLQLFLRFLRFGLLAFGGPVAQIAMVKQALVEEERWISPARFNRLLAVMQVLPGPEAHELCVHLGMVARGRIGGLLAGVGFMLPGFVLMLGAAWLYKDWFVGNPAMAPIFLGVQIAVLAIILRAVQRIGTHILEDRLLWGLAAASLAATLAGVPFWIPLVAAGLIYSFAARPAVAAAVVVVAVALALLISGDAPVIQASVAASRADVIALFIAGLKGGLLTFGGAYTAIPYVRADTVGRGWVSDASFLDGVALAGMLPAPLVIFATFAGYVAGGFPGALAITAGMFLPAFAFSMIFYERLEAVVENPALHRALAGVAAAVVGVIAATLLQLGWVTALRVATPIAGLAIFAGAVAAVFLLKGKWVAPLLVVAAGAAGWLLNP
ncbi:chromate transporter [Sphingopyxis sp. H050]|jgi:chromate transporter|uniref:chromate efflux transporter n=1 Tax=Sphingopyxis sp. H050 TaxID=1759072 RepID=UPI000736B63A|nr:chromate efflux transporter [Sphingopyxis sp. H050]KTE21293.1 chromate transporter [Sphingopyxis sp. H050]